MPPENGRSEAAAADPVALHDIHLEPDREEVVRYLGYPKGAAPDRRVLERVDAAIEAAWSRLRPRGAYTVLDVVASDRRSLTLHGGARFAGAIGDYLGAARRAAVFVATAGAEIVRLAEEALRGGDVLGGLIHGAIGSQAAEAAVDALIEDLRARIGPDKALSLRYSPGYCGMSLAQQRTIFGLVDARAIGVELLPTLIMKPLKSVSGLVGIGPAEAMGAHASPCDRCPLLDCKMRR